VRRLFSLLNFSDRFEKKSAQGDDRFVARSQMLPGPVIDGPQVCVSSLGTRKRNPLDSVSLKPSVAPPGVMLNAGQMKRLIRTYLFSPALRIEIDVIPKSLSSTSTGALRRGSKPAYLSCRSGEEKFPVSDCSGVFRCHFGVNFGVISVSDLPKSTNFDIGAL